MFDNFYFAFNTVFPIIMLSALGYLMKKSGRFDTMFFKRLNQLTFKVGFSAMMFINMYNLESIKDIRIGLSVYILISIIALSIYGIIGSKFITPDRKKQAVLIQNTYRSNFALVGVAIASAAVGSAGVKEVSLAQLPVIIYNNIFTISMLAYYTESGSDMKAIGKKIVNNPLLQGQIIGILVLIIRNYIPINADGTLVFTIRDQLPWMYRTINYLNQFATPAALIALGGQFEFSSVTEMKKEIIAGTVNRLLIVPFLGMGAAILASKAGFITLTPPVVIMLIALYGTPCATASSVMAQEMGADGPLSVQMVVWSCLFSMPSLFLLVFIFKTLGYL